MNYADLFRVTLPETVLEVAALLVLVVDLGFLRKAALRDTRGCGGACWESPGAWRRLWAVVGHRRCMGLPRRGTNCCSAAADRPRRAGRDSGADRAHAFASDRFRVHAPCGRVCRVVLMSATGGLLISAAQDLLVIFIGLELLSLGLYILTAFAKSRARAPKQR